MDVEKAMTKAAHREAAACGREFGDDPLVSINDGETYMRRMLVGTGVEYEQLHEYIERIVKVGILDLIAGEADPRVVIRSAALSAFLTGYHGGLQDGPE